VRISAHFASAHATSALICCAHALLSAGPAHSGVDCSKLPIELLSAILQHMPQLSGVGVQLMPEPLWQPASSAQAAQARLAAPSLPPAGVAACCTVVVHCGADSVA
jgi:hypothetical protein